MIEIIISIIVLAFIILLTWNYLTTDIILLVAIVTFLLVLYRFIYTYFEKKDNKMKVNTYKNFVDNYENCTAYIVKDQTHQYEIERMMNNEYKKNPELLLFNGYTNKDIIENSYSKTSPVYKYKQPYYVNDIFLQLQDTNGEKRIIIYYEMDNNEIEVCEINKEQAQDVFSKYNSIESYALKITGGNIKYTTLTQNGVILVKKESYPYEIELLIQYEKE